MKKTIWIWGILLFTIGCKKEINKLPVIDIDITKTANFNISEIADTVIIIPLETKRECLISNIKKIKFSKNYIFVSDAKKLLQFDIKGKFIKQIGKRGNGPGEFITILDFCIDTINENIVILSYKKLQSFNFQGQFLEEKKIHGFTDQIEFIDSAFWVSLKYSAIKSPDNYYHNISKLIKLNYMKDPVDSINVSNIALKQGFEYINPQISFFSFSSTQVYFYYPMVLIEPYVRDTLYKLEDNSLIPAYKFNFGERINLLTKNQNQIKDVLPYSKFRIINIHATLHYLYVLYSIENDNFFLIYDTKKDKQYISESGFNDDYFQTGKIVFKPFNIPSNYIYFIKEGFEISDKIKGISKNSNPTIFILNLKE